METKLNFYLCYVVNKTSNNFQKEEKQVFKLMILEFKYKLLLSKTTI